MGQNVSCVNPTLGELRSKSAYWKRESTNDVINEVYRSQSLHRLLISYVDPNEGFFPYENLPDYADLQPKLQSLSLDDPDAGFLEFIFNLIYDDPDSGLHENIDEVEINQLIDEGLKELDNKSDLTEIKIDKRRFSIVTELTYPLNNESLFDSLASVDNLLSTARPSKPQIYIVVGTEGQIPTVNQPVKANVDREKQIDQPEPSPIAPPRHNHSVRHKRQQFEEKQPETLNVVTLPRISPNKIATKSVTYDWVAEKPIKVESSTVEQHPNDPNIPANSVAERIRIFSAYSNNMANLTAKPYSKATQKQTFDEVKSVEFLPSVQPDNQSTDQHANWVVKSGETLLTPDQVSPDSPTQLKSILNGKKHDFNDEFPDGNVTTLERKRVKFDHGNDDNIAGIVGKAKNILDTKRTFTQLSPNGFQHAKVRVKIQSIPTTEESPMSHHRHDKIAAHHNEDVKAEESASPTVTVIEAKPDVEVESKLMLTSKSEEIYEISIKSDEPYTPGSVLSLMPRNDPKRVEEFLQIYQLSFDDKLNGISIGDFVSEQMNLSCPPPLQILTDLCHITELPYDLYREFRSESAYQLWIEREKPDIFTLLTSFADSRVSLPPVKFWLKNWPPIEPRLYYITSVTPGLITFNLRTQKIAGRYGLATNYLLSLNGQLHSLNYELSPNANFQLPSTTDRPIVLITSGFGLTSVRWILQLAKLHSWDSRVSLIYNPPDSKSVLYASEVLEANADGRVSELFIFYGEPSKCVAQLWNDTKIFPVVQHKLDLNGHIYVTGPRQFCQEVRYWLAGSLGVEKISQQRWYQEDSGAYQCRKD